MLIERLSDYGIRLPSYGIGSRKVTCPQCSAQRRNKNDLCLSVTIDDDGAVWQCHNHGCGFQGSVRDRNNLARSQQVRQDRAKEQQPPLELKPLPAEGYAWFRGRSIGADTLHRAGVGWAPRWLASVKAEVGCIAFAYRSGGKVVNAKFRPLDGKAFAQVKDGEKLFYLADLVDSEHGDQLVIVEGELDALSCLEAGILNAVSVPDGAPAKVKDGAVDPADDKKFSYVWNCRDLLATYSKIILATDADAPGRALAEELARRIGPERCWLADWPEGCKDANDVLVRHGKEELAARIACAQPYPVKALYSADAFGDRVLSLYRHGRERGLSTGWAALDGLYSVAAGQLTVVTGTPNAGKSEFIDALAVNLAEREGWRFAVCSFENPPEEHISKLAEKRLRLPFWDGPRRRMTEAELGEGMAWVREHFMFIRAEDEAPTIHWILERAAAAVARCGVRGLILDPYNELEHKRPATMSETEYVSELLGKVKRFAQTRGVHVWFVAHPAKMQRDAKGNIPVPTLYDISGSAHWVNKPDVGLVVHRVQGETSCSQTEIYIRKIRFKWVGRQGKAVLDYDRATGIYSDPSPARAH